MSIEQDTLPNLAQGIPPSLRLVLHRIPGDDERLRFGRFFVAAARAIRVLSELDLARYEMQDVDRPDLSVWEAIAPAVRETMNAVNAFLQTVRTQLNEPSADVGTTHDADLDTLFRDGDEDYTVDESRLGAIGSRDGGPRLSAGATDDDEHEKLRKARELLHAISGGLAHEMTSFGEGLRNPKVLRERWFVLDHVAMFRGKFRAGIGEMVFLAAREFVAARREDVVPYYRQELDVSAELRRALTLLAGRIKVLQRAVEEAPDADRRHAQACMLFDELNKFVVSDLFPAVRASDKKAFFESRSRLARLTADAEAPETDLLRSVEGFAKFLDSLRMINHRESLIVHDRDALALTGQRLLRVERAIGRHEPQAARDELRAALTWAQRLFGRDTVLDDFLRLVTWADVDAMALDELRSVARIARTHIEAVAKF